MAEAMMAHKPTIINATPNNSLMMSTCHFCCNNIPERIDGYWRGGNRFCDEDCWRDSTNQGAEQYDY